MPTFVCCNGVQSISITGSKLSAGGLKLSEELYDNDYQVETSSLVKVSSSIQGRHFGKFEVGLKSKKALPK